ncbi:MAG: choice-of-anchor B family protein [Bacteroidetes bacterium]|jgi:choice-of-anchor B domain-containing protein|nr:choice-of-anchor B family protein [Bacteroidota bacterium]
MFRYLTLSLLITLLFMGCSTSTDTNDRNFSPCENGTVEGFPCEGVDYYSHLTPQELNGERLNDIWGWTDPQSGREYALVGLTDGVSFVDITNPAEPLVVGKLLESTSQDASAQSPLIANHDDEHGFKEESAWRDLKVFENTMYVVSEQGEHGLQVFDLTRLRSVQNPPEEFREDVLYSRFGNAHNIAINEESGFAYVVGSTTGEICAQQGGLHMVNLGDNPLEPSFAGCHVEPEAGGVIRDGYVHDTQCITYTGPDQRYAGEEICFSSAEQSFLISNVTDKENPATISNTAYPGVQYSHQGWLTDDRQYFFMNDEADELDTGNRTRTYVWDMTDLEQPEWLGFFEHSTLSVDHNLYVSGSTMYQANYTSGLRVIDISNPEPGGLLPVGFFDTTPDDNRAVFAGIWSVYPFFNGDKVIVSDIDNGLFVLRVDR